ncbi:hypothetical protein JRO89_XS05G0197400 [Xanthoceras sorbifolium]|uniref:Uncharacterized protein n=1 Tax=Xanthoceras sorbifolium TaxID=99658 RepID=A0ABQ8I2G2_9ROSI|nr:hypothetical protein JRO89_XS05G0197400 [Xanthoceras sorbifolium]
MGHEMAEMKTKVRRDHGRRNDRSGVQSINCNDQLSIESEKVDENNLKLKSDKGKVILILDDVGYCEAVTCDNVVAGRLRLVLEDDTGEVDTEDVGHPRTRPKANLNGSFEHGRGSEQDIDMEAEVRATSFDGSGDPDSAHAWLLSVQRQNPMAGFVTVDAYEKKFTELSRAAPHIVENEKYVPNSSQASVKQPVGGSQQSGSVGRVRLNTLNEIVLGRPQTQARVFALTQQDVEATPDVVTGSRLLSG